MIAIWEESMTKAKSLALRHISTKSIGLISALSFLALLLVFTSAHAQVNLQIGGSEAEFKARLTRDGFDRIDTVKIGLSSSSFDACKADKRYRIKFEWTGNIKSTVIGNCRTTVDVKSVRKLLRDRGYRRITIEDRAGKYLAVGCLDKQRYRVEVNYLGDIGRERRIGSCQSELTPADITAKLEEAGYDRIFFSDRQLPRYVAEACKGRNRVELTMNRFGEISDSQQIGRCQNAVTPDQIVQSLKERGYTQVKMIDDKLPRYVAQGCKDRRRIEVTLNRWGEIANEVNVGRCQDALNAKQITASMRENGYKNVSVTRKGRDFVAKGCRDNRYNEIVLSRFGELVSRRELGSCDAPRINDLAETLRKRGLDGLQFFAEGCRNGKKVRIAFDEFANRTGREVIGGC